MKTSLIIPALNEATVIGGLVRRAPKSLLNEVIVVDNGSNDETSAAATEAGARVIHEPRRGYGWACWAGLEALKSKAEIVAFLDGDGSQRPEELSQVLAPILSGQADFVLGARQFLGAHPWHAVAGTKLLAAVISWRYHQSIKDVGPFRAIRVDLLRRLGMQDRAFGWPIEMIVKAAKARARIAEVPVSHGPRLGGESKVSGTVRGSLRAGVTFLSVAVKIGVGLS
jgi:glycosyltransferase involved in cell wall biosynthesis